MTYVYHMVPKKMVGDRLLPLNRLKEEYGELYLEYTQKYLEHPDRSKLLKRTLPKLECLWNDVLFFLPLHPYHVYDGLHSLGISIKEDVYFYQIPITQLQDNTNAYYIYSKENYRGPAASILDDEIELITPETYKLLDSLPDDTRMYFKEEHMSGRKFGMFAYIPHLLSLGEVDISQAEVINWSECSEWNE